MSNSNSLLNRILVVGLLLATAYSGIQAQSRLVLNGGTINLSEGAYLVIDNAASNAIMRTGGFIISEGENNILQWNIGTATGTYTIPWGYGTTNYLPLTFTKTAGVGSGYFLFSTYHTGWQNSALLPTGIPDFNGASGADKSAFATDRFWQINAQGYTTNPGLTNLAFTYLDSEFSAPNTNSTESGLSAQRWNSTASSWTDFGPGATVNTTSNTVTLSSVPQSDLYSWWAVNYIEDRHWVASSSSNWNATANWSTTAGGPGGASVPTAIDAAIFDAAMNASVTLDMNAVMNSLNLEAGYTGTLTQGANDITVNTKAILGGGTFTGGTGGITIKEDLELSGTTFTSTSGTLDLKQDFIHSGGTFAHHNGTVKFSGTDGVPQEIAGSAITNFNNILVTNVSSNPGVQVESDKNLNGILTLSSNVVFDADGSSNSAVFTLISTGDNPTVDASIAALPSGAVVSGGVTVQRYMTKEGKNNRLYRYISSPLQNATVSDMQQEIPVMGKFTGKSVCSGCGSTASLYYYNETVITDINKDKKINMNDGYIKFPVAANSETFVPGKGYALNVLGNLLTSTSWDLRGNINAGNFSPVSLSVSYTSSGTAANDGWNLVGNPFPSSIDWNSNGWTKTNLENAIYITDNGSGSTKFATWNGLFGVNGGTQYIATGQAFWVKASGAGAPVLTANENVKSSGTQTTFFRTASPEDFLRITLVKGSLTDETIVHFRSDATAAFDANMDARKMMNASVNLSSVIADGSLLAINSLPLIDCNTVVKLAVDNVKAGSYQLTFKDVISFTNGANITLKDKFANKTIAVGEGAIYSFSVSSNSASFGSNRFELQFLTNQPVQDFVPAAQPVCAQSNGLIQISNSQSNVAYVAMANNKTISSAVDGNGGSIALVIDEQYLPSELNNITIYASSKSCATIFLKKDITLAVIAKPVISVKPAASCESGSLKLKAYSSGAVKYDWFDSEAALAPDLTQHDSTYVTPILNKSKTYYVSAINASGCETQRVAVVAEIGALPNVFISQEGNVLKSSYENNNQWYFNSSPISEANNSTITLTETGTYKLTVSSNGCSASAVYEYVVTAAKSDNEFQVTAFPNPVIDVLNIEVRGFTMMGEATILNSEGQVIGTVSLDGASEVKTGQFNVSSQSPGIYFVRAISDRKIYNIKFIKED